MLDFKLRQNYILQKEPATTLKNIYKHTSHTIIHFYTH